MGVIQCSETKASQLKSSIKERHHLICDIKSFINENRDKNSFTTPPIKNNKLKKGIEIKSNLSDSLNSKSVVELSLDIVSAFSNMEIAKVHNPNVYISMLFPNVYENSSEDRNSKVNTSSNNLMLNSNQNNNVNMNFVAHNIDKINDMLNLNNGLFSNEKQNRFCQPSVTSNGKQLFNNNNIMISFPTLTNLNASHNSNFNDLMVTEGTLSRRCSMKPILTIKSGKDSATNEDDNNKSIRHLNNSSNTLTKRKSVMNGNDNFRNSRFSLSKIKEFCMEKDAAGNDFNEEFENNLKSDETEKNENKKDDTNRNITNKMKKGVQNVRKNPLRHKRLSYSVNLRKRIFTGLIKKKNNAVNEEFNSHSPFDLFSSQVLDPCKNDKITQEAPENKDNNIWFINLKENLNKKKSKNTDKQDFHFSINLKVIIKQEIKESLQISNSVQTKQPHSKKRKVDKKENLRHSELFRDSIDKYLNLENSFHYRNNKRNESSRKNKQNLSIKNNTNEINFDDNKNNIPNIEIVSKLSLSNFEDKDGNFQYSQINDTTIQNLDKPIKTDMIINSESS